RHDATFAARPTRQAARCAALRKGTDNFTRLTEEALMDADFWHQKWQKGDIGFHEGRPNQFLATHFDALRLPPGARVFLPLCGKTRDIAWLLAQGCKVVGAELSEQAIGELFAELELQPVIARQGAFIHYSVPA